MARIKGIARPTRENPESTGRFIRDSGEDHR